MTPRAVFPARAGQAFHSGWVIPWYTISGTILDSEDAEMEGVTVTLGDYSTDTGEDGTYSLSVPSGTSGDLTPTVDGYTFDPETIEISVIVADTADQDFVGTAEAQ